MLETSNIKRFYQNWVSESVHSDWSRLWMKQYKIVKQDGNFVSFNKLMRRMSFSKLCHFCVKFQPLHLYMSVLNWLMPDKVASKNDCRWAYPVGGEYVLDLFDEPHFKLSSDITRVMTFPESLNGESGLVCARAGLLLLVIFMMFMGVIN
jgi:hypothetical protein